VFTGARVHRARLAEPARFEDSGESAGAGSLGNYLDLFSQEQEETDVARHPAGKIEESGTDRKTVRLQVALPPEI
jgi:hypothetical protein